MATVVQPCADSLPICRLCSESNMVVQCISLRGYVTGGPTALCRSYAFAHVKRCVQVGRH
jgi:hypothetical protein